MKKYQLLSLMALGSFFLPLAAAAQTFTPTNTNTPVLSGTITSTPWTHTRTPTNTTTSTPSNTPTKTPTNTGTFVITPTFTFTPTSTNTITPTLTGSPAGPTATFTSTPTPTLTSGTALGSCWTQTTAGAAFGLLSSFSVAVFDPSTGDPSAKMWVLGGQDGTGSKTNQVFNSPDGVTWTSVGQSNPFSAREVHTSLVFDPATGTERGKMWIIGGEFNSTPFFNDVWYSGDGSNWTRATANAGFAGRSGHGSVVFNGKMWVIGGYDGNPAMRNDVWSSPDGVNWTQVTAAAAFPARSQFGCVVFNGKIWVMGGIGNNSSYLSDVWCSSDGANWTQATGAAAFGGRYSFNCLVYNNQIWVMGGAVYTAGLSSDVWNSPDGVTWAQATAAAPFSRRSESMGMVFDAGAGPSMWVVAGWDGTTAPYFKSDVWTSCPATLSPTPTWTPTPSSPVTLVYINPAPACAAAFGCSVTIVDQCRQLDLDVFTSYMIMRICALCGTCQPSDIMTLRLTMGWDQICAAYGIDWSSFVADLQARMDTLEPEIVTPNQLYRGASNDPSAYPSDNPAPNMPDVLIQNGPQTEVCPSCI